VDVLVVNARQDAIHVAALRFAHDGVAIDGMDHFVMRLFVGFKIALARLSRSRASASRPALQLIPPLRDQHVERK
jgi:hypothetical protein